MYAWKNETTGTESEGTFATRDAAIDAAFAYAEQHPELDVTRTLIGLRHGDELFDATLVDGPEIEART